jgi:DNA repair protein RecO (recombination protein O)
MYLTVRGLVTRVTAYNDTDAILTILSAEQGKLAVKARGLRRKNSPLTAPCQLLCYGEFTLFEYRGMYTINEAHALQLFTGLRKDLCKLSLATYFAQVCDTISQEDLVNPQLLSLALNCLYALDKLQLPLAQIKGVFELRCACLAGYMPYLEGCYRCGCAFPDRFNISEGRLECTACKEPDPQQIRMPLSPGVLDSMRYIVSCSDKQVFGFRISEATADSLSNITEAYLTRQLEQGFSTLDFYKSLYLLN